MRIVSLEPGATAVLCEIGLADLLAGVADDPDPDDLPLLATVPFVAHAERDSAGDRRLHVDEDALAALEPDLVVLPGRTVLARPPEGASLLTHDPTSLEGVFNAIATLGAMTAAEDAALGLVEDLRDRLGAIEERVRERLDEGNEPTRVVVLEWLDPPQASGRWIPEQVRRAGGWELLGREGGPAIPTTWEAIVEVDPDALLVMTRGLGLREAVRAWEAVRRPEGWADLAAVRSGRLVAVDARSLFTTAGPRLLDGIALLAELLDPVGFPDLAPDEGWAPLG